MARLGRRDDAVYDAPRSPMRLTRRPEQRDRRCLHGGSDVHRRGIDTHKRARMRRQCGKLLQRQRSCQIDDRCFQQTLDRSDHGPLIRRRCGGQHHALTAPAQFKNELGKIGGRPGLEKPPRGGVNVDEALVFNAVQRHQRLHFAFCRFAGNQHQFFFLLARINAEPA